MQVSIRFPQRSKEQCDHIIHTFTAAHHIQHQANMGGGHKGTCKSMKNDRVISKSADCYSFNENPLAGALIHRRNAEIGAFLDARRPTRRDGFGLCVETD